MGKGILAEGLRAWHSAVRPRFLLSASVKSAIEPKPAAHLFVGPCSLAQCLWFGRDRLGVTALQRAQRVVDTPARSGVVGLGLVLVLGLGPWTRAVFVARGSIERRDLGAFSAMRRGDLASGRGQCVALLLLLLALLAEQERHGGGSGARRTLQWQLVPTTHAFGLQRGRAARGLGAAGDCAGNVPSAERSWGRRVRRASAAEGGFMGAGRAMCACLSRRRRGAPDVV